jgi:hypothetical protein
MGYGEKTGLRDVKASQLTGVRADLSGPGPQPYSFRELMGTLAVIPVALLFAWGFVHLILRIIL